MVKKIVISATFYVFIIMVSGNPPDDNLVAKDNKGGLRPEAESTYTLISCLF
jgi:hypothetical protein